MKYNLGESTHMKASDLMHKNPVYSAMYKQMLAYQQAYLGGYEFKTHVRKKRPSEDSNLYLDLIDNTVAQPICRYIVDTINDVLFEPGIKRELEFCTPDGTPIQSNNIGWTELFLLDADLQNRSLNAFMEHVGDLTSIYGHCWVFVDMPREEDGNLGRPYVVAVNPIDVFDWEFDYYGGKPILRYAKVKESETETHFYFKCYYLGTEDSPSSWVSYEVNKDIKKNDVRVTGQGTFPAGMSVPGFIAYGRRDPRRLDVGVSDIDSATDAQREYYKLECEAYTSIQFAKTIIRAEKGVSIPVHAGAIVRASEGQVETIPVDTGDVDKVMSKQAQILEQIEALTGLGGLRNTKNQIASGVAIIEERKQLHRLAKSKARLMETTEEMIFTFAARYMGMRWAGEVHYNTDYEAHDTNYRMALMKEAKNLMPENDIIDGLISKEIIGMLAPQQSVPQFEQAYIDTIENQQVRDLMSKENNDIMTRDIGSQIPTRGQFGENDIDYSDDETSRSRAFGGPGTMPTNVGTSYQTEQAIAVQLQGINVGR